MKLTCPRCGESSEVLADHIPASFTADCSHCQLVMLVENGTVYDLHRKLHEDNERWPEDGEGVRTMGYETTH